MPAPTVVAIFGPTAIGKTAVALALGERLRERGEDPAAVCCDSIQIYRGLELTSAAPTLEERSRLEHRLVSFVDPTEEFSAGRFAALARDEIDRLLEAGRRPIVVGGTGLYMRAALSELELRPPVDPALRKTIEAEVAERGPAAVHGELPADVAGKIHPNDRKRVARALELLRSGKDPPERGEELWTARLRHPTLLIGLLPDRAALAAEISERVGRMAAAGAREEVEALERLGPSRTARAALGYEQLLAGDLGGVATAHRRYARRQLTWMRRMDEVVVVETGGREAPEIAERILGLLDAAERPSGADG